MGSSGNQCELNKAEAGILFENPKFCKRGLAFGVLNHFPGLLAIFPDGGIQYPRIFGEASLNNTQVFFCGLPVFKKYRKVLMRFRCFGKNDESACVAVEPVHRIDGAVFFLHQVFQRGLALFTVGYGEHPCGFVQCDERVIFKKGFNLFH